MKLAYITTYDATDIKNWSGLGHYIAKSLYEQNISIDYVGSLVERNALLFKGKQFFYKYFLNKRYLRDREPVILKHYAQQAATQLAKLNSDIVFSPGTVPIAYLECKQPIVFWTDATFAGMVNFYGIYSNLCQESIKNGHEMEKFALEKCKLAIYTSDWAASTAINHYHINPNKVKIVPFGANINCDRNINDIKALIDARPANECNLLFLGVDWFRKGGDVAFEVAKKLNEMGLKTSLTIVGCEPLANKPLPNFIKSLGFISKASPSGLQTLNKLLSESHFLILPSRAECTAVVFCEASSFGVPSIATNVGGTTSVIKDHFNGKTFSLNADISGYCTYIYNLFADYSEYKKLALSSFEEYESRLNWLVAGQTVKKLIEEYVS